jgi:LexA-binding, inner membrane-associated putative hydrolase
MPSPLGHALGGLAAGWLIAGRPTRRASSSSPGASPPARLRDRVARVLRDPTLLQSVAWFGALGMLADLDFLIGRHSHHTHSVAAVALVGLAVLSLVGWRSWAVALAAAAAYSTHLLFDWMGHDTSPPIGILALWPVSDQFYQSSLHVFDAISRRYWLAGFWSHNLRAVAWELLVLVPVVALVARFRTRAP